MNRREGKSDSRVSRVSGKRRYPFSLSKRSRRFGISCAPFSFNSVCQITRTSNRISPFSLTPACLMHRVMISPHQLSGDSGGSLCFPYTGNLVSISRNAAC